MAPCEECNVQKLMARARPLRARAERAVKLATTSVRVSLLVGFLLGGCHRSDDEPIRECNAYTSMYDRCLHRLDNGARSTAEQRGQKLRAALEAQVRGASDSKREELRASCAAGLKQLEQSCR